MISTRSLLLSLTAAGSFALLAPASAALVTVNQSAFSSAATVVSFEDLPGSFGAAPSGYGAGVGLTLSATTKSYQYTAYGSTLAANASAAGLGSLAATWGCGGNCGTGFSLAAAQDLVGFSISSNVLIDTVVSAYLGSTLLGSQTVSVSAGQVRFIGFQDLGGIDRIVIGNNTSCVGCVHQLDGVMFESAGSVPEPMSLALVGLGLLGVGIGRRGRG